MGTFNATNHKKNITLLRTWAEDTSSEDYTRSVLYSLYNQYVSGVYGFFGEAAAMAAAGIEAAAAELPECSARQRTLCLACAECLCVLASKLHGND